MLVNFWTFKIANPKWLSQNNGPTWRPCTKMANPEWLMQNGGFKIATSKWWTQNDESNKILMNLQLKVKMSKGFITTYLILSQFKNCMFSGSLIARISMVTFERIFFLRKVFRVIFEMSTISIEILKNIIKILSTLNRKSVKVLSYLNLYKKLFSKLSETIDSKFS